MHDIINLLQRSLRYMKEKGWRWICFKQPHESTILRSNTYSKPDSRKASHVGPTQAKFESGLIYGGENEQHSIVNKLIRCNLLWR